MEMWDYRPVPRHRRNNPSFSSSLLDAIYRSIDAESDSTGNVTGGTLDPAPKKPRAVPVSESPVTPFNYHSSDDDADSARMAWPRPKPARPGPVLTRSDRIRSDLTLPLPNPNPNPTKNSISIEKKLRDLKKSTSPSSPGAKLAGFLNSLFTPSNHKKAKISKAESPSPSPSYSRSCLSKTPSTHRSTGSSGSNRTVRFSPVGVIVGEDCRPCGEKFLFDDEAATAAERRRRRRRRGRVVEEMMKGFEMEAESGGDSDDGSEDLFELENLVGINGGGGGDGGGGRAFMDELPVYGTTDLGTNCAIAKGLVV